jgi:hypothetical protein
VNRVAEFVALAVELRTSLVALVTAFPRNVVLHTQIVDFFRLLCTMQIHPSGNFVAIPGLEEVFEMASSLLSKTRTVSNEQSATSFSESLYAL